jgi:hypothetical protein
MELSAGVSRNELVVDVTNIVRAVTEGATFHGFLFTVPLAAAEGFDPDHATLLEAALGNATLEITSQRAKVPARLAG